MPKLYGKLEDWIGEASEKNGEGNGRVATKWPTKVVGPCSVKVPTHLKLSIH